MVFLPVAIRMAAVLRELAADRMPVEVPPASTLAMDYYRSGIWVWFAARAWTLAVPALIVFTGLSARLRDLARRVGRTWLGTIAVYGALYVVLTSAIDLPIDYALGFARSHAYGLSNQTWGRWFGDELKSTMVAAVIAMLLLWIPYLALARSPRRWWAITAAMTLPIAFLGATVMPVWIDPLFNRFGPMKDKALEARILRLADRAGIDGARVFEVDKSRDTTTLNAYVTGAFGTKRIVLWDTLLDRLDGREVLAVMGHEMGHYVLGHVAWGIVLSTIGSFALLFLVDRSGRWIVARCGRRIGFDRLGDVASVPLLALLIAGFNLIGMPMTLAVSRSMEHEADRFALEITRANRSAATAFVKLQHQNLSNPRPGVLSVIWRSSHPPIGERIDFCNAYHPWLDGLPGRYGDRFRPAESARPAAGGGE